MPIPLGVGRGVENVREPWETMRLPNVLHAREESAFGGRLYPGVPPHPRMRGQTHTAEHMRVLRIL